MEASTSTSPSSCTSWRAIFLTLRDEVLNSPTSITVIKQILNRLLFSQSETLLAAALSLPAHEVTSDVMFLVELVRTISNTGEDDDTVHALVELSNLIRNLCHLASFEMTSSTWGLVLNTFGGMVEMFLGSASIKRVLSGNIAVIEATKQCLETVRCIIDVNARTGLSLENVHLLNFFLSIISCSQAALASCFSSGVHGSTAESGKMMLHFFLWEIQTTTFTMISELFSRVGTSLPVDHWQSTIDALRNIMDVLASKGLLMEGNVIDRFYTSLLHCLHLVLINSKGSLQDHVAGFVAALRLFFNYGLTGKSQTVPVVGYKKNVGLISLISKTAESTCSLYRPPHLREKNQKGKHSKGLKSSSVLDHPTNLVDHMSSDSDLSDSDGSTKGVSNFQSSRIRVAAIVCIQDLCRSDPKSFTAQWTMLLPSRDVLQARRYEANLMTCLLFDPYLKARVASASTLATMLEGPASIFLQVAEYKEPTKLGSFTALSSLLGQILMQLHTGILYLIKHEKHTGFLTSLFKILALLISCTPYSRMPVELLPRLISDLEGTIVEGFPVRGDQTGLLAVALNCLTAALSVSPPSREVNDMFLVELSTGHSNDKSNYVLLSTLFHYSEPVASPTISIEALQALKAVAHNYPSIMILCWKQVSSIVSGVFNLPLHEDSSRLGTVQSGQTVRATGEKVTTCAIKLLDECLRAICGFKGTEDLSDDKLLDSPFTSDYIKVKTISSAPSYGSEIQAAVSDEHLICSHGSQQWCEAIENQLPITLFHTSAMVRAASITCFAGITSGVFFSLPKDKQDQIITYSINAALDDEVPSVRSAACRAVGVIACFPQVFKSVEILHKFVHAAEVNSNHPLVSVRITASWALANLCDSLRHCIDGFFTSCFCDLKDSARMISLMINCSLRLTADGDKIKANAVRALGNLSRFIPCPTQEFHEKQEHDASFHLNSGSDGKLSTDLVSVENERCTASKSLLLLTSEDSHWLERMVQAFLSCITTGNVKVRWNVCHALSNLFLNETLKLQYMEWAPSVYSILLLLLRDSSNFKIRIQAAAALSAPATILDYGKSYSDVVLGVGHILENLSSDQMHCPSSFKYRVALEKQLTSTMLHVLGLASGAYDHPIQDFLIKKASFLEEWLRELCLSLGNQLEAELPEHDSTRNLKKEVISRAVKSLVGVYERKNHHATAERFDKLVNLMV